MRGVRSFGLYSPDGCTASPQLMPVCFLLFAILFGVFPLRFVLSPIDAWLPFRPSVYPCVPLIDACSRLMCVPT